MNVKDPAEDVKPQVAICRFYDPRDSTQPLVIHTVDVVEASMVKLLQARFATNPDFRSAPVDRGHVTHAKTIARTEYLDSVAVQHGQGTLGVAKPHAAQAVGELNHHPCLGKVLAATIRCPNAVCESIQSVAPERNPEPSESILGNRLQEKSLTHHFAGEVDSNQIATHKMPEPPRPAEPKRLIRCVVGESRIARHRPSQLGRTAGHTTKRGRASVGVKANPYRPMVIRGHSKSFTACRSLRKFLSDERTVKESMETLLSAKPDITLAIDQLCTEVRIDVVGFGISPGDLG